MEVLQDYLSCLPGELSSVELSSTQWQPVMEVMQDYLSCLLVELFTAIVLSWSVQIYKLETLELATCLLARISAPEDASSIFGYYGV